MQITKQEVVKIISAIKVQCPEALNYQSKDDFMVLVDMWFDILQEYPQEVVWQAVRNALKNTQYQKQNWIGAICQEIEKMQEAYEKSESELWGELTATFGEVNKYASRFSYNFVEANGKTQGENARLRIEEIFNNLSPELKEYVRNMYGLMELADLTDSQLNFEKGRFLKTMPQLKQRARTRQATGGLSNLIQGITIKFLEDKPAN